MILSFLGGGLLSHATKTFGSRDRRKRA